MGYNGTVLSSILCANDIIFLLLLIPPCTVAVALSMLTLGI